MARRNCPEVFVSHDHGPIPDGYLEHIAAEPDDMPTTFLSWLALGTAITVIVSVVGCTMFFNWYTAGELEAKGYGQESAGEFTNPGPEAKSE